MRTLSRLLLSAAVVPLWLFPWTSTTAREPELIASTPPLTPAEQKKLFRLPPGFEIELFAAEPMIRKPINMNFDDRGRLWVTESVEYPFPAKDPGQARDSIKILEDTDGDGRADAVTVFAGGLNIPIGLIPVPAHPGAALGYSIPNVYRFLDTRGGDAADKRDVVYRTFGFRDTHGMASNFTAGFDGWVYACHGFSNTSEVRGSDGNPIVMQSGNTWRMRPDGSHCEYFTHGQVNPFGLCFDVLGNLYSADCHSRPIYQLVKGGYYPSFGKPHDGLGFAPEMCDHDHGSTAICGLVLYEADHFPNKYRGTDFIGNVVTNRINHDVIEWHGSSPKAIQQADFLACDDPWFRPVDIKLGPDGALYVADFYNRIIGHYEVPLTHPGRDHDHGRVWRIVYRGADPASARPAPPCRDFTKASTADLVKLLSHPNLTVRLRATANLAARPGAETATAVRDRLADRADDFGRAHALWVLDRLGSLPDADLVELLGQRPGRLVGVHALRIAAGRPVLSGDLMTAVRARTADPDPFIARAAAEALGAHPSIENMTSLLALRLRVPGDDSHLMHTVRISLRDQLASFDDWAARLKPLAEPQQRALADVALGVPSPVSAVFLLDHVRRFAEPADWLNRFVHHAARYGTDDTTAALVAFCRANNPNDARHQAALFKSIQQGQQERGAGLPADARAWAQDLAEKLLSSRDDGQLQTGVELAASVRLENSKQQLVRLTADANRPEPLRKSAAAALAAVSPDAGRPVLGTVLADALASIALREHVAQVLAGTNRDDARKDLIAALPTAPARLQTVIATGLAGSAAGGEELLAAVAAGKASARLLQERGVVLRLEGAKVPNLNDRLAKLTHGLPAADQRLQDLMHKRRDGFLRAKSDPAVGFKVFEKSCAGCHQIGGKGAKVGPQLDGVGVRGLDRLLEDILDPNRNVDQAFRSTTLVLKSDQIVTGLVLRDEGEIVVLADSQGKEVRVEKKQIESRTVSSLSPMPANVADPIAEAEFYHLLAYLLSQKQRPEPGR